MTRLKATSMKLLQHWWLRLGLWPRTALVLTAAGLVLFATFTALGEWTLQVSEQGILGERLVIARMAAAEVDETLQEAERQLQQTGGLVNYDPNNPDHSNIARLLHQSYLQSYMFTTVLLLDAHGVVIVAEPSSSYKSGTDLSATSYVTQALSQHADSFSDPFQDQMGYPVMAITVPLQDTDQNLKGLLVGLVDLNGSEVITPMQKAVTFGNTAHAVLLDSQGKVVASTEGLPFLSAGEHPTFYRSALATGKAQVQTVPFELSNVPGEPIGHLHVMAFAPLQEAGWGIAVGGDESVTFAAVHRLRFGLAFLGLLVLASIWALTLGATRLLIRPVQRLTTAAQRIASGELEIPLQAVEGGEIGQMADALEQMRRSLLKSIEDLARLSETLETRVHQRTEALRRQEAVARQLLRRAIAAQEEERRRIAYELHDEIGQGLTAMRLELDRLSRSSTDPDVRDRAARGQEMAAHAVEELRRVIAALHPGILDQLGLVPALQWIAERTLSPLGITIAIEANDMPRLPPETELVFFRIAQEALHNVARHSGAHQVVLRLERQDGTIVMTVKDDGRGFDPAEVVPDPDTGRGLGLAGMHERASLLGGSVRIVSAPGQGTMVEVRTPLTPTPGSESQELGVRDGGS